ncbi:hypothetical protein GCM10009119_37700 [Algoriphagus jejuensis]|uniref:Glycoside hydrolase family 29 N-terminal domain-containing protein n=1 Tax=Algoriphagus jejuensis TaxID=419934 RepID=A0ABN1N4H2_9BACT
MINPIMKNIVLFFFRKPLFLCLLVLSTQVALYAQDEEDPYAKTRSKAKSSIYSIRIDPESTNVLASNMGELSGNLEVTNRNYMDLWASAEEPGPGTVKWILSAPSAGEYDVDVVAFGDGSELVFTCNGDNKKIVISGENWDKINLGKIKLNAGNNALLVSVTASVDFRLGSLELTRPAIKAKIEKEALAQRQDADWFKNAGYGLMFQCTNRATPIQGPIKKWQDKVNDFDLDGFVSMVEESGAAYVLWSVTWGEQYISAPIQSLDEIIAGRTTQRDLLGEMADRLHEKGIRLIFYYHYGYKCYHARDIEWLEAVGGLDADKTELYDNLMKIISEIGLRYKDKLDGWWFDGGERYYNTHFDGSSAEAGILSAPFKEITQAAKAGNSSRIIAYNSWIKPMLTPYQDYFAGEGFQTYSELEDGKFTTGKHKGLMAHSCFILEKSWGHIEPDSPIKSPKFSVEKLTEMIQFAQTYKYPLSINLEMYEDGSVSPESIELLKQIKTVIRD